MASMSNADVILTRMLNGAARSHTLARTTAYFFAVIAPYLLIIFTPLLLWMTSEKDFIQQLITVGLASFFSRFLIAEGIYLVYKRPRPFTREGITPLFPQKLPSFPSGHAAFFGAVATYLCFGGVVGSSTYALVTICMCVARMACGVHYPSDVIAGLVIGALSSLALYALSISFLI